MARILAAAILGWLLTTAQAFAHDYTVGSIKVLHPYAFETTQTARTGGGYLSIENTGETDDVLLAVEADFPRVMLHTTEMQGDVTRMVHLDGGVPVPAGQTVALEPGAMHVMFMGLSGPFLEGGDVPATLIFENAGAVEVVFKIEARDGATHSGMDHADH